MADETSRIPRPRPMFIPLQIAIGLGLGYLAASISESLLHRFVGHARAGTRRYWARHPRLFGHLLRVHYRHAVVHHGLTYRSDHVTQFDDQVHRSRVDRVIGKAGDPLIVRERYGLTIGLRSLISYNLTVVPALPVLAVMIGPWSILGALPMLMAAPLMAMVVHPSLHRPYASVDPQAPRHLARLLRTRYFRYLVRHHFLHHEDPTCNFNLLLGGDWLFGVGRRPDREELDRIRSLGLPID
ncbi:hypothetical protein P12x_004934 [Tundrisphaera lichenicola]|uniref:hypothetical protein n=1 Tax=Tundrisphaera lichenicola TaxID=2029860 RepID=UPI003EB82C61